MPNAHPFYQTPEWRSLRAQHLRHNPRCRWCGKRERRMQVDHIKPWKAHPHLALAPGNLQTLCTSCHRTKTRKGDIDYNPTIGTDGWPVDGNHPFMRE